MPGRTAHTTRPSHHSEPLRHLTINGVRVPKSTYDTSLEDTRAFRKLAALGK